MFISISLLQVFNHTCYDHWPGNVKVSAVYPWCSDFKFTARARNRAKLYSYLIIISFSLEITKNVNLARYRTSEVCRTSEVKLEHHGMV